MTARKSTLNNMSIQNYRRSPLYQALVTDLCLEGIIPKEKAEAILGYEIPLTMKSPTGKTLEAQEAQERKPQAKKKDSQAESKE